MEKFLDQFHHRYAVDAYRYLGSHYENGIVTFRVYAPHAEAVSVVGDFNAWNKLENPMHRLNAKGVWETTITGITPYMKYKYWLKNGKKEFYKQDPYAYHQETEGETCSKIYDLRSFTYTDAKWEQQKSLNLKEPLNIYEVNFDSWRRHPDNNRYSYRILADTLLPYVHEMGYTHLEIMPLTEYPYTGSWGYQTTGYYAITSRYGPPADFMYFVNKAHELGLGVILDWVPSHFAKDDFGLIEFDGDYLYEDPHPLRMEHHSWGTRVFNYAKPEIRSFLISNALFLLEYYHLDGLRVDAVASMLYLDYDRKEWVRNIYGGNHNLEAIAFLKDLNSEVKKHFPKAMMIAEESTDFAGVTAPVSEGGLGFTYKWNMGWMNDSLNYINIDPYFRRHHHQKLTFSLVYAFSENYILPLSHDEVVHLKKSMLSKMPGNLKEKMANLRAFYGYMLTHPGKKLSFMGMEIGQLREWNHNQELDWWLLKETSHRQLWRFIGAINHFYRENDILWELDSWQGFQWINSDDADHNLLIFRRQNSKGKFFIVIINFSGCTWEGYRIETEDGFYQEVINSDLKKYGGSGLKNTNLKAEASSLVLNIPALSILILKKKERKRTDVQ
jgi:1,4-alpha-glucan branching enzyme